MMTVRPSSRTRAQQDAAPRRPTGSRGCRWARRRRRRRAWRSARGRSRPAAAGRRTARAAGASSRSPSPRRGDERCRTTPRSGRCAGQLAAAAGCSARRVNIGSRLNDWKTKPTRSRRSRVSASSSSAVISVPPSRASPDVAGSRPGEAVHQRRLARAGRAHDRGERPGGEVDVDPVERADGGLARAVDLGQAGRADGDGGQRAVLADGLTASARPRAE